MSTANGCHSRSECCRAQMYMIAQITCACISCNSCVLVWKTFLQYVGVGQDHIHIRIDLAVEASQL
eukprot:12795093-Prorocentrum_lima.AAC.1